MSEPNPGSRILFVVEDDPSAAELVQIYFEEFGYVVRVAHDADAARALAAGPEPSALVTDLFLAGPESGLAVARWYRDRFPDLPILITSGVPAGQIEEAASSIRGARVVPKPLRLSELRSTIESLVEAARTAETPE